LLSLARSRRPRVLFLVDRPRWAYDHSARQIQHRLRDEWDIEIRYVVDQPIIERQKYDLLYVFFWGEKSHFDFGFDPRETIKELSSHRWLDGPTWGPCTPRELAETYLWDADTIACTSVRLQKTIDPILPHVAHAPNGIDERHFRPIGPRRGVLTIGWAGDARDSLKGVSDILIPACEGKFRFLKAPGSISHRRMNRFYNRLDVFAVASRHEGEPLTLIESMAAGCFPVCCDVGIVPELVRHRENGWIVSDRSPEEFREAFAWCGENLEQVRMAGLKNAETVGRERSWSAMSTFYRVLLGDAHRRARQPRFRNDDVSWDADLARFREFCGIFQRHGLTQVHGVTLFGRTAVAFEHDGGPCEYQGLPNLAVLPNAKIRELSAELPISRRADLVEHLRRSPDEIALHGLYHTDYSAMSPVEQEADIRAGLAELARLFPGKRVRYFIPPFNRTSGQTVEICRAHRLHVLGTDGIHLEEELHHLRLAEGEWHRYHHHRFYPESKFGLYGLSLTALDAALARAVGPPSLPIKPPHWLARVARMFSRAGVNRESI
jgi:glycosyltransferase involved in cell wall biosynthesis